MLNLAFSLEQWVFEKPWPIVVVLAVVWALMRLVGVRLIGGDHEALGRRLRAGSWGVLLIAALVWGVAWYVQTPAERMVISMRQLLLSVEQQDWATFDQLTADDAEADVFGTTFNRRQMDAQLAGLTIDDITLLTESATYFPRQREGVTEMKLRVQAGGAWEGLEGVAGLDISVWAIHWRQRADGSWEATRFEHVDSGLDAEIDPEPSR